MRIVSVNVGLPREVLYGDETVRTGIFKEPVAGRVAMRRLNLAGDAQADLADAAAALPRLKPYSMLA